MKINKILTPLEIAAKALFKNTTGNDLGKKYPYLTENLHQDIFVSKKIHKLHEKSVKRRKW